MAVSRRLRFEILRRDAHACRYCGATAPDIALTVDHVIPTALGGTDLPTNLVTACQPCNAGKSATAPDSPIVDDVAADALRWSAAMRMAAEIQGRMVKRRTEYIYRFDCFWTKWKYADGGEVTRPENWRSTVGRLHDLGIELDVLGDLIDDVLPRNVPDDRMWRYFNGAVRNVLEQRQEIAAEILDGGLVG